MAGPMEIIDNLRVRMGDVLARELKAGDRVCAVTEMFSLSAFSRLKDIRSKAHFASPENFELGLQTFLTAKHRAGDPFGVMPFVGLTDAGRYQFTWPGKRAAMAEANVPTTKTLAPCVEESVDFATTQNLYIEGDNLEVLKILRASYLGQVKMIYIDPPYNTGHDFVNHDRFAITQEEADQRH